MAKYKDLTGCRFGRLLAKRVSYIKEFPCGKKHEMWECLCDCGKIVSVDKGCLTSGGTISCGCFHREKTIKQMTKHGKSKTRIFYVWYSMRKRCQLKSHTNYKYYGGKGIKVCDEWQDFSTFQNWAFSNGWKEGLTIDRINPNGDYCPENCRIVDYLCQNNNKCNTRRFLFHGKELTIREISGITGIPMKVIEKRIWRGWNHKLAFETPLGVVNTREKSMIVRQ